MKKLIVLLLAVSTAFALAVPLAAQVEPTRGELTGGAQWGETAILYSDADFTTAGDAVIANATCAYNEVLENQGVLGQGILYGGSKDMSALGSPPWAWPDVAFTIPNGEIWVTHNDEGTTGPYAYEVQDAEPELERVASLIVLNTAHASDWDLTSAPTQWDKCDSDHNVPDGLVDLQGVVTHELGHAYMDFNDICSSTGQCDAVPENQYIPEADCPYPFVDGSWNMRGYTMCTPIFASDGDDLAGLRWLEPDEQFELLAKYDSSVIFADNFDDASQWISEPVNDAGFDAVDGDGRLYIDDGGSFPYDLSAARLRADMSAIMDTDVTFDVRVDGSADDYVVWFRASPEYMDGSGQPCELLTNGDGISPHRGWGLTLRGDTYFLIRRDCSHMNYGYHIGTIPGLDPVGNTVRVRVQAIDRNNGSTDIRVKTWTPGELEPTDWAGEFRDNHDDADPLPPGVVKFTIDHGGFSDLTLDNLLIRQGEKKKGGGPNN